MAWSVFDGDKWLDISLECLEGDVDDDLGMARAVVVASRFDQLAGLYELRVTGEDQPALMCQEGQYYNVADVKVLWHNPHGGGCWMLSEPAGVASASTPSKFTSFVKSAAAPPTLSPEDADWHGAKGVDIHRVSEAEGRIRATEDESGKFCDADFPADSSSIGDGFKLPAASAKAGADSLRWVRAPALLPHREIPQLFNKIEPDDILQVLLCWLLLTATAAGRTRGLLATAYCHYVLQGALGDCWLLAAIAAVAEFPQYISEKLFVTQVRVTAVVSSRQARVMAVVSSKPSAHYPLPTIHCPLPTAHCPLPSALCPLPTTYHRLPTAYCLLPTIHCPHAT
jgi:hypothetical protein